MGDLRASRLGANTYNGPGEQAKSFWKFWSILKGVFPQPVHQVKYENIDIRLDSYQKQVTGVPSQLSSLIQLR